MALARCDDGGATFGAPARVHRDGWAIDGRPHSGPAVTTDAGAAVHVAWATGAPDRAGIWRAVSTDRGASFGEPSPLAVPSPLDQVRATTVGGQAVFAVEDPRTTRVDGDQADLAAGPDGWRLVWHGPDGIRQTDAASFRLQASLHP
ncbi:hypothetical protein [Rubrivirga sp.]|uniref:hypothetical protein n=1 Tax=Rubrivirga sp. TaxID=1885344 RepID=UPI003B52DD0A